MQHLLALLEMEYRINEQYSKVGRAAVGHYILATSSRAKPNRHNSTSPTLKRSSQGTAGHPSTSKFTFI